MPAIPPSVSTSPPGSPSDRPLDSPHAGSNSLLEACKTRFASPDYEVECDARQTVWVKRVDGSRSFGLQLWLLQRHSMSQVLERVERKLALPARQL